MADRLVLHPSAALIELRVGQLHDVERVGDLDGVGEHRVEHRPVRAGQIQVAQAIVRPPRVGAGGQPPARLGAVAARHHVQQHAGVDVDDRRRPPLPAARSFAARTTSRPTPTRVGLHRSGRGPRPAPCRRRSRRRSRCASRSPARPATSFTVRPLRPTWTVTHRPGPIGQRQPRRGDRRVVAGPRPRSDTPCWRTPIDACATPAEPVGRTPAGPPARPSAVLHPAAPPARGHDGGGPRSLTMHPQRLSRAGRRRRARSRRASRPAARTCA